MNLVEQHFDPIMKETFVKIIPRLVGLVFLYTAISKLFHPAHAIAALESLGLRYGKAEAVVFAVITLEFYLGLILLFHVDLKWGLAASTGLMFLFAVFLWYLSTKSKPPSCGCMGLSTIFKSAKQEAWFGLARNCAILWLLKRSYDYYFKTPKAVEPKLAD